MQGGDGVKIRVDDMLVKVVAAADVPDALAKVEQDLVDRSRLVESIIVGNRQFWSTEDVDVSICSEDDIIEIRSCTISEFVADVVETAIEYSRRLREAMQTCADQWGRGQEKACEKTWSQILDGIEWMITAGSQIIALSEESDWPMRIAKLSEVLESVEGAMERGAWKETSILVRYELRPAIRLLERWFSAVDPGKIQL